MPLWICDVNGVLVASVGITRQAFRATARHGGFTCTERDFQDVKALSLVEAYGVLDPDGDPRERLAVHLRYVRSRIADVYTYPSVHETLAAARAAGVTVAAVTSYGEIAEACLVKVGLYPLLDCLVTQEEVKRPKPSPDAILQVLALFGAGAGGRASEDVLYVGDTVLDIEAGRAAGVRTIGACYGASAAAEIRTANPDRVIDSFAEMRSFLVPSSYPASETSVPVGGV